MKELMAIFLLAAVIGSLVAGCCPTAKAYSDPSQAISVDVGQEFVMALDSNPTTGYTWQEKFDASFLELVDSIYEPSSQTKRGLVGAGGTQSFKFKALQKGKTSVTLVYQRPWEKEPLEEKVFTVNVN